jgi:uncharacterized membrane protein YvbJ
MSETVVEERLCEKCGVGLRDETQFCHSCGEPVNSVNVGTLEPADRPMQSAATLRQRERGRKPERKTVEVVWEPAQNRANISLIAATVIVVIFAVIVISAALYYR